MRGMIDRFRKMGEYIRLLTTLPRPVRGHTYSGRLQGARAKRGSDDGEEGGG
jgi:hypothetical protein